jgi:hypothetical protein
MTTRCRTLAILIIVPSAALAARTASAQTANRPRVELGGTFSAILPATLQATENWREIDFRPNQYTPPIDMAYCYVHSLGANRGVLEIDRLELVR